jgi:hypothetical protein
MGKWARNNRSKARQTGGPFLWLERFRPGANRAAPGAGFAQYDAPSEKVWIVVKKQNSC